MTSQSKPQNAALSPRERVLLALDHQETDRVPITLICAEPEPAARRALARHLAIDPGEGVDRYLSDFVDLISVGPSLPDAGDPSVERTLDNSYQDVWGVRWAPISHGEGVHNEISHHPLADIDDPADLHRHHWPSPDWWDYDTLPDRIAHATARRDYALIITSANPFERACWMRGFERTLLDMMDNPDLFHEIMSRVTDFYLEATRRTLAAARGRVDLAFTADDIAGQTGLLLSLPMWEQHIKPYHARVNRLIHEFGVKVVYHSDGAVMDAVPGLLDMGIDVLQALQFSALGMDPKTLKDTYGHHLCFQGGISVQTTLPFGTVEDVRREVRERIAVLAKGGGSILSPSHTIMPGTPPENIVAMFEAARPR